MAQREDLYIVVHDPAIAVDELQALERSGAQDGEIWVERENARLCVLIGGARAFLMYLRHESDSGFSSRNNSKAESLRGVHAFALSNGQIDEYPLSWTYPREDAFRAMTQFAETGQVPADIEWHNESGDGQTSPS